MKAGFSTDIEEATRKNTDYRRVLFTGPHTQLVLMSLKPGEEIGEEVHSNVDQFFRFEDGQGVVVINGARHEVRNGSAVVVPSGARHNVINTSAIRDLKLYTLYSPPEHPDKLVARTKPKEVERKPGFAGIREEIANRPRRRMLR